MIANIDNLALFYQLTSSRRFPSPCLPKTDSASTSPCTSAPKMWPHSSRTCSPYKTRSSTSPTASFSKSTSPTRTLERSAQSKLGELQRKACVILGNSNLDVKGQGNLLVQRGLFWLLQFDVAQLKIVEYYDQALPQAVFCRHRGAVHQAPRIQDL